MLLMTEMFLHRLWMALILSSIAETLLRLPKLSSFSSSSPALSTISTRKWAEQIDLVYLQFATHLLAAMQAVDLAGKEDFAPFTQQVHQQVRKLSAFVEDDRALDSEAEAVCEWLKTTPLFA